MTDKEFNNLPEPYKSFVFSKLYVMCVIPYKLVRHLFLNGITVSYISYDIMENVDASHPLFGKGSILEFIKTKDLKNTIGHHLYDLGL